MKALLFLALISFFGCTSTKEATVKTPVKTEEKPMDLSEKAKSCICPKMWMPVCGANGQTYGNTCEADCAGVKYTVGACGEKI